MIKKIIFKLIGFMPKKLRYSIIRKQATFKRELPDNIIIKIADTQQEISDALELLHKNYVNSNLSESAKENIRISKYNLIPTTLIVIIKEEDTVVGTVSIIQDSKLGLPLDELYDISELRNKNRRVSEISALAIKPGYKMIDGARTVMHLITYTKHFVKSIGYDDYLFVAHPNARNFYEALFCVDIIKGGEKKVSYVKDAPAMCYHLDLVELESKMERAYKHIRHEGNMYDFYYGKELCPNYFFLESYDKRLDIFSYVDESIYKNLLVAKASFFDHLTISELGVIKSFYNSKENSTVIDEILKKTNIINPEHVVREKRLPSLLNAKCVIDRSGINSILPLKIIDLSEYGLLISMKKEDGLSIKLGETFSISLKINIDLVTLKVICQRFCNDCDVDGTIRIGVRILVENQEWSNQFKEVEVEVEEEEAILAYTA